MPTKKYVTEEERKATRMESNRKAFRRYFEKNRAEVNARHREHYKRNKAAILAAHRREYRKKYKAFTKEAQTRPWDGEDKLTPEQQAKLKRIANAITAEDIE